MYTPRKHGNECIICFLQKTFSKNGQNTIEPKAKRVRVGQRESLSPGDIMQARVLYNCPS